MAKEKEKTKPEDEDTKGKDDEDSEDEDEDDCEDEDMKKSKGETNDDEDSLTFVEAEDLFKAIESIVAPILEENIKIKKSVKALTEKLDAIKEQNETITKAFADWDEPMKLVKSLAVEADETAKTTASTKKTDAVTSTKTDVIEKSTVGEVADTANTSGVDKEKEVNVLSKAFTLRDKYGINHLNLNDINSLNTGSFSAERIAELEGLVEKSLAKVNE